MGSNFAGVFSSSKKIELAEKNVKFVRNGWGDKAVDDVEAYEIEYDSDGNKVKGYFVYPKDTHKKYPLIIWNRGGGRNSGHIDRFLAQGMFGEIASWGYAVLASDYRKDEEFGGRDVNDILNLFPLADKIQFCDSTRIGMEGWSRGGMMTYRVLSQTDRIKCAVIISGIADMARNSRNVNSLAPQYPDIFGQGKEETEKELKKRSAVDFYKDINKKTALLLIHGTGDKRVSHKDSEDMYEKLKSENMEVKLKLFEGGDHYLKKHRKEVAGLRKQWFDGHLK